MRRFEGANVGRSLRYYRFDEVESTNQVALDMGRQGEPEGAVAIARTQSGGRGRLGRSWWDSEGESALLSVLLRPLRPYRELPQLAFVAAVAVANCLIGENCPEVSLKWPNDVLVRGKKVAGILVETAGTEQQVIAVIGIGINVNQRELPPDIAETATSIFLETGQERDPGSLAEQVAERLLADYEAYLAGGFEEIAARWRKHMWGVGRQASVEAQGETILGEMTGIDAAGALTLVDAQGMVHVVHAADNIRLV